MEYNTPTLANRHSTSECTNFSTSYHGLATGSPLAAELENLLIDHTESSYLFRIQGFHWADQGIVDGDIAVVDRARSATPSDLVICWQDNGFHISRARQLLPGEEALGVVTSLIHPLVPLNSVSD